MITYKNRNVTIFQSPLYQTNASVIVTDDMILVVDPTTLPYEIIEIRNYISNIRKERPVYVFFTHSDWDHILGYNGIDDVIYIGSEKLNTRNDKEKIIEGIKKFDDQYYLLRDYDVSYPQIDYIVDKDKQQLVVGRTTITFYTSPGHTDDGLFAVVEPLGVFISGDYLSDIEFPYIYFNSYKYEDTMNKVDGILKDHKVDLLIPGHGNPTENHQEMIRRKNFSLEYINDLRNALMEKNDHKADQLLEGWQFPQIMKEFHNANKTLLIKENQKGER